MAMLWDNANSAMDFNIGGTTEMRLQDGVLRPETDNDVDLGASGAEFKDLYLDGVAYIDDLRADALGAALNCASQAMTNINVDSGVIDGTVIGGNSAAAGTFAALVATTFSGSGAAQFASSVTAAGALNVSEQLTQMALLTLLVMLISLLLVLRQTFVVHSVLPRQRHSTLVFKLMVLLLSMVTLIWVMLQVTLLPLLVVLTLT